MLKCFLNTGLILNNISFPGGEQLLDSMLLCNLSQGCHSPIISHGTHHFLNLISEICCRSLLKCFVTSCGHFLCSHTVRLCNASITRASRFNELNAGIF